MKVYKSECKKINKPVTNLAVIVSYLHLKERKTTCLTYQLPTKTRQRGEGGFVVTAITPHSGPVCTQQIRKGIKVHIPLPASRKRQRFLSDCNKNLTKHVFIVILYHPWNKLIKSRPLLKVESELIDVRQRAHQNSQNLDSQEFPEIPRNSLQRSAIDITNIYRKQQNFQVLPKQYGGSTNIPILYSKTAQVSLYSTKNPHSITHSGPSLAKSNPAGPFPGLPLQRAVCSFVLWLIETPKEDLSFTAEWKSQLGCNLGPVPFRTSPLYKKSTGWSYQSSQDPNGDKQHWGFVWMMGCGRSAFHQPGEGRELL